MITIESGQFGLLRTASITCATNPCPARMFDPGPGPGCSSFSAVGSKNPKFGSTKATDGSVPACASSRNELNGLGGNCGGPGLLKNRKCAGSARKFRKLTDCGTSW